MNAQATIAAIFASHLYGHVATVRKVRLLRMPCTCYSRGTCRTCRAFAAVHRLNILIGA